MLSIYRSCRIVCILRTVKQQTMLNVTLLCTPDLQPRPRCRWLCLSALPEAEDTQHPSQDTTQVRGKQEPSRDAELHPEGSTPPSFHSHPAKNKKKKKAGEHPLDCSALELQPFHVVPMPLPQQFALSKNGVQAHTHNTITEWLASHCVCSDTAPFAKKKNSTHMYM